MEGPSFTPEGINVGLQLLLVNELAAQTNRGCWRGSTEKPLVIVVGHAPLCQYHPPPTAADRAFHKQEDGLAVSCVVSWCFGIPRVLEPVWAPASAVRCGETERSAGV